MHVFAHRRHLGQRAHDPIAEIIGVRTREAHAADARNRAHGAQEIGEIVLAVVVGVHRLPEQHDLTHAIGDHVADLANHVGQTPAAFRAARVRYDAVGAAVIAATLHGDPRLDAIEALRREVLVVLLEVEVRRDGALAAARAFHQRGKGAVSVRTDHQAHMLRLLQQLRAESLRHAPRDADDAAALHVTFELAEPADHALFGVIANGAGVDKDDVGAFRTVDRRVAFGRELPEHQLGVAHVHLAAVRLYVDGPLHLRKALRPASSVSLRHASNVIMRGTPAQRCKLARLRSG